MNERVSGRPLHPGHMPPSNPPFLCVKYAQLSARRVPTTDRTWLPTRMLAVKTALPTHPVPLVPYIEVGMLTALLVLPPFPVPTEVRKLLGQKPAHWPFGHRRASSCSSSRKNSSNRTCGDEDIVVSASLRQALGNTGGDAPALLP